VELARLVLTTFYVSTGIIQGSEDWSRFAPLLKAGILAAYRWIRGHLHFLAILALQRLA